MSFVLRSVGLCFIGLRFFGLCFIGGVWNSMASVCSSVCAFSSSANTTLKHSTARLIFPDLKSQILQIFVVF